MLLLRVLETSARSGVELLEDGLSHQQIVNCALSIVSGLWTYRETHGLRLEYWLAHASFFAARALLPTLKSRIPQMDNVEKACRLPYDLIDYLPVAQDLLIAIRRLMAKENIQAPIGVARIFSYLAARTEKTIIKNVRICP